MGQKINPNIFRLGVTKTWKTEFFEKKNKELSLYTFKDLEIKEYIERFLETQGIIMHDYKQHYSNSTFHFYISYFVTSNFISNKMKSNSLLLINKEGNKKKVGIRSKVKPTSFKFNKSFYLNDKSFWKSNPQSLYKLNKQLNADYFAQKFENDFKRNFEKESLNIFNGEQVNSILNNMCKVLSLFTHQKFNIVIHFCCINKDLNFLKVVQKKNFVSLQKFRNTPFFKEGIELLFHVVCNKNSENLLVKFIGFQIQKIKRHKFFLAFLKKILTTFMSSSVSQIKGVKVIIKGRLNGVPRAKHKILTVGDVPVQSISEKINYAQTTVHNSNGSYGIKVWVVEKN